MKKTKEFFNKIWTSLVKFKNIISQEITKGNERRRQQSELKLKNRHDRNILKETNRTELKIQKLQHRQAMRNLKNQKQSWFSKWLESRKQIRLAKLARPQQKGFFYKAAQSIWGEIKQRFSQRRQLALAAVKKGKAQPNRPRKKGKGWTIVAFCAFIALFVGSMYHLATKKSSVPDSTSNASKISKEKSGSEAKPLPIGLAYGNYSIIVPAHGKSEIKVRLYDVISGCSKDHSIRLENELGQNINNKKDSQNHIFAVNPTGEPKEYRFEVSKGNILPQKTNETKTVTIKATVYV